MTAVILVPMTEPEFAVYVAGAVPDYALDKVRSGQWSEEASLALSQQGFDELLPRGLATPDNFLFTVRDPASQSDVGMLWYAVQERAGQQIGYVYDVLVKPQFQRKGYATGIFEALERDAGARGLAGIALHVFAHNPAAIALYEKLGYRATDISMFKKASSESGRLAC